MCLEMRLLLLNMYFFLYSKKSDCKRSISGITINSILRNRLRDGMYCAIENACLFTPTNICVSTHVNSPKFDKL